MVMTDNLDELSIAYEEEGTEKIRELDKYFLSRGAWATVLYRYQEWDNKSQDFGSEKYSIRRYQKRNGQYWQKSKFNISSQAQAKQLIDKLNEWLNDPAHQENT
jgi:outer membrane receptor for Fe3+-dicitrate